MAVCLDFSALPSLLDVLTPPGEARPLDLSSSRGPGASFFRPLLIDIESLFCRVFILQAVETPFSSAWAVEYRNFSASPTFPTAMAWEAGSRTSQVSRVDTWNLQDLFSVKPVRKRPSVSPNWAIESEALSNPALGLWAKGYRPHKTLLACPMGYPSYLQVRDMLSAHNVFSFISGEGRQLRCTYEPQFRSHM